MSDLPAHPGGRGPRRVVTQRRGDRQLPPHPAAVDRPGLALLFAARELAGRYAAELGDVGFTWQIYVALNVIKAVPGLHQQGIRERSGLDRTTLSALLADLADDGFVTCRPDPLDTRRMSVAATASAPGALAEMGRAMGRAEEAQFRPLKARQRGSLERLLAQLIPERLTITEQILADFW